MNTLYCTSGSFSLNHKLFKQNKPEILEEKHLFVFGSNDSNNEKSPVPVMGDTLLFDSTVKSDSSNDGLFKFGQESSTHTKASELTFQFDQDDDSDSTLQQPTAFQFTDSTDSTSVVGGMFSFEDTPINNPATIPSAFSFVTEKDEQSNNEAFAAIPEFSFSSENILEPSDNASNTNNFVFDEENDLETDSISSIDGEMASAPKPNSKSESIIINCEVCKIKTLNVGDIPVQFWYRPSACLSNVTSLHVALHASLLVKLLQFNPQLQHLTLETNAMNQEYDTRKRHWWFFASLCTHKQLQSLCIHGEELDVPSMSCLLTNLVSTSHGIKSVVLETTAQSSHHRAQKIIVLPKGFTSAFYFNCAFFGDTTYWPKHHVQKFAEKNQLPPLPYTSACQDAEFCSLLQTGQYAQALTRFLQVQCMILDTDS